MKCTIPEISWHNRDPVLSVDIQSVINEDFYRLASGGTDSHVLIWHLKILNTGATAVEAVSDLTRHQRAVNVVRWSPSGHYLASGDDDANIIVWQQKADDLAVMLDGDNNDKEKWSVFKVLRGHKEDVYDICWSPDSLKLVSGSVDNTAIIWNLAKGNNENILKDHKGFVQGVTWDPVGQYIATLSSDRTCRVFNETGKQVKARISKGNLAVPETHPCHGQIVRYYHDDTLKSFFRRLTFSPDGNLIITPAGYLEMGSTSKYLYTTYVYTTSSLTQPAVVLPSPGQFTIAARCCPILFELWAEGPDPVIDLPYRMVIAVATRSSVILYDTQQTAPFAIISNIHYTRLTDVTWSSDGKLLAVSSTDGFCSLVTFEPSELGKAYVREEEIVAEEPAESNQTCEEVLDTSLNVSVDVEAREKKSSFLEQWATKSAKKSSTVIKNESKRHDADDDVVIIEPESEKENENKVNVITVVPEEDRLKTNLRADECKTDHTTSALSVTQEASQSEHVSNKTSTKKEQIKPVATPTKASLTKSQRSSPAKLIAVRRKPRNDQMNITQFLKSPRPSTSTAQMAAEVNKSVAATVLISEDSVARDAWICDEKEANILKSPSECSSESTSSLINTDIILIDDSQDIKLVLEDSTMQEVKENASASKDKARTEKMDCDQTADCKGTEKNVNKKQDSGRICIVSESAVNGGTPMVESDVKDVSQKSTALDVDANDSKCSSSSADAGGLSDKRKRQKTDKPKSLPKDPATQKKRIAFITLSSPKHKKKPF